MSSADLLEDIDLVAVAVASEGIFLSLAARGVRVTLGASELHRFTAGAVTTPESIGELSGGDIEVQKVPGGYEIANGNGFETYHGLLPRVSLLLSEAAMGRICEQLRRDLARLEEAAAPASR